MQEKNEQLTAEKDKMEVEAATEVDSDMALMTTGGWGYRRVQPDEIAEDAVALLLKHSVGHQEISKGDSSWVPPLGKARHYPFVLIKSTS